MSTSLGTGSTPDVVDAVLVQPKTALLVRAVDEMLDVLPNVVGQLLKQHLCLVVREGPHDSLIAALPLPRPATDLYFSSPVALLNETAARL